MKTDTVSNQLRWAILLLAAAVILPTVCLLWFMNQAVKNERLAVRTKLQNAYYSEILRVFSPFLEWVNTDSLQTRSILNENTTYEAYKKLAATEADFEYLAQFIDDVPSHKLLYPTTFEGIDETEVLQEAMLLEFQENNLQKAYDAYAEIEKSNPDTLIAKQCRLAQARILQKQQKFTQAIDACELLKSEPLDSPEHWRLYTAGNLKILLLLEKMGLNDKERAKQFNEEFKNLLYVIENIELLTSDQRVFLFDQLSTLSIKYSQKIDKKELRKLEELQGQINLERKSLDFYSRHPDFFANQSTSFVKRINGTDLYATQHYFGNLRATRIIDLKKYFETIASQFNFPGDIFFRVFDAEGNLVNGPENVHQPPFLELPVAFFFDWTVKLYEKDVNANAFEQAAKRQTTIYIWTGILVIALVISAGTMAIRSMNQQIKMNRLKNDFIATVTHELKTPLASMRLLVDTLLEGRCKDEQTATEYLQLVSNENKRLTHLIDSFLTFSRMERNKQVFDMQPVSPKSIADGAVEAMQAKLSADDCQFTCDIDDSQANVYADIDGMVTVLVNLLDNAYKYTNGDKEISLKVFEQAGYICFAVSDNGIGLGPQAKRKVFNRFYQVDSRLSRSTEGCGLGLSIVKFITDAHKGDITIDSQADKGSTFTVKLPKA